MYIFYGMKGTKTAGLKWKTILNIVLSSLGFVKHATDNALYIFQRKSNRNVIIVGCSAGDFLRAYSSTKLFKDFLGGLNKYSPVTSKEGP